MGNCVVHVLAILNKKMLWINNVWRYIFLITLMTPRDNNRSLAQVEQCFTLLQYRLRNKKQIF